MNLFVDKGFLFNFEVEYDWKERYKNSPSQEVFRTILSEYTSVQLFVNYKDASEALGDSQLINIFSDYNPSNVHYIENLNEYLFSLKELPFQTVVFFEEDSGLRNRIGSLGGLFFDYNTYERELFDLLQKCHVPVGLSAIKDFDYSLFADVFQLPTRGIIIDDPYILKKRNNISRNLLELVLSIAKVQIGKVDLGVYSCEVRDSSEKGKSESNMAIERHTYLNSKGANLLRNIFLMKSKFKPDHYNQHDRWCYLEFAVINSGPGFDLIPFKKGNGKVESKTIFDKFTFGLLKSHLRELKEYNSKMDLVEFHEDKFKVVPSLSEKKRIKNFLLDNV